MDAKVLEQMNERGKNGMGSQKKTGDNAPGKSQKTISS